jgi:hypothetical protein
MDERLQKYQDNMKALFYRKTKDREFLPDDLVLNGMLGRKTQQNMVNLIISGMDLSNSQLLRRKNCFY